MAAQEDTEQPSVPYLPDQVAHRTAHFVIQPKPDPCWNRPVFRPVDDGVCAVRDDHSRLQENRADFLQDSHNYSSNPIIGVAYCNPAMPADLKSRRDLAATALCDDCTPVRKGAKALPP